MIRRCTPLLAALVVMVAGSAEAREAAADIQQFKPVPDVHGFVLVHDATLLPQFRVGVGFALNYAVNPLEVQASGYGRQFGLVDGLLGGDLTGSFSLFDWWEVSLAFPFMQIPLETAFFDSPLHGGKPVSYGIGDLRFENRLRILDPERYAVGLAVAPFFTLPTGNERAGLGRGEPGNGFRVVVGQSWKRIHFAVNLGYAFYARATTANLTTGNELTYGAGIGVSAIVDRLDVNLELDGSLTAGKNDRDDEERLFDPAHSPAELVLSARGHLPNGMTFLGGVSKGISNGFGTPDLRVFAGVGWGILEPRDRDKDGLNDREDGCVSEPEDPDGYEDQDGCPDPDNDADGVWDILDACPNEAEDRDGFGDSDGCPDPDNDLDGILDGQDACPVDAEDVDGFDDEDGCPDPDNDADGIPDGADVCPNKAEDFDSWRDDDGCPDDDNDDDGIADAADLCPNDPEDLNGTKDDDGCPDSILAVKTGDAIVILEKVYFATGKDQILRRSDAVLLAVAGLLRDNPSVLKVQVQGHTDSVGADDANQKLSQRRAEAVMRRLIKLGIAGERLTAVGFGESRPIGSNHTDEGRERNRRVEFKILEQAGTLAPPAGVDPWGGAQQQPTQPGLVSPATQDVWGAPAAAPAPAPPPERAPVPVLRSPAAPIWGN